MGKIDDMRRLREQQFASTLERRAKGRPAATAPKAVEARADRADASVPETATVDAASSPPTSAASRPARAKEESALAPRTAPTEGKAKCAECGKLRRVTNGAFAAHQKGFGKACPGSRKKPA